LQRRGRRSCGHAKQLGVMPNAERRWELGYLKGHPGGLRVRVDSRWPGNPLSLSRQTAYGQIADALRAAILAGDYEPIEEDPTRNELPGAAELGAKYGVSDKTAARAVQQLIAEGLVVGRPGLRPVAGRRAQRELFPAEVPRAPY
jgi:Bacterial regulatory proteins, gntR family